MYNEMAREECGRMTPEGIAILIASLLLFVIGFKLGEERGKGELDGRTEL